jgi:hypothetical protein
MDYIDQIKRVNALAKQLQQQGLAVSLDEALKLAQNMVEKNEDVSKFFEDAKTKEALSEGEKMDDNQKLQSMERKMDQMEEKFTKQISGLVGKMNEIISEINKIEEQIKKMKSDGSTSAPSAASTPAAPAPASHPRSGTMTPSDVSIEKFFNFNKRR